MKDPVLLTGLVQKAQQANQDVQQYFSTLSFHQLNWRPAPLAWSIGQCLDHLVVSDLHYFPTLKQIAAGQYEMKPWEKWNPLRGMFGKMLVLSMQEQPKKKYRAPRIFLPEEQPIQPVNLLERFTKHQESLVGYLQAFHRTDLDQIQITSPASRLVTYSLRHALIVLLQHQYRHINQARRVENHADFPRPGES